MTEQLNPLEQEIKELRETVKKEEDAKNAAPADDKKVEAKTEEVEAKAEPVKEAPKEKEPENADYARMRREAAQAKKEAAEAKREAEQLRKEKEEALKPKVAPVAEDAEPDKAANYEGWLEWKNRQLEKRLKEVDERSTKVVQSFEERTKKEEQAAQYSQAVKEFMTLESEFKAKTPDYEDAANHMTGKVRESFKTLYPQLQGEQLDQAVASQILQWASHYAREGQHPIEALYQMNVERFGYQKKAPVAEPEKKAEPKINLAAIEKNKKRAVNGQFAGGKSGAQNPSIEGVADMTMAQFSRLTPAQREELKQQSRGR